MLVAIASLNIRSNLFLNFATNADDKYIDYSFTNIMKPAFTDATAI